MKRAAFVVLLFACFPAVARASTACPTVSQGQVWTVDQWNTCFSSLVTTVNAALSAPAITGGSITDATISGGSGSFTTLASSAQTQLLQTTLIGGTSGGNWTVNGAMSAANSGIYEHIISATGTTTDTTFSPLNVFTIGHDSRNTSSGIGDLLYFNLQPGTASEGTKHTLDVYELVNQLTADHANSLPSPEFNPFRSVITATVNEGGTGTTSTTSYGNAFGGNTEAFLSGSASDYHAITGFETDIQVCSACSTYSKIGLNIVEQSTDVNQGVVEDAGLVMANKTGASTGWNIGIQLGSALAQWPFLASSEGIQFLRGTNDQTNPATISWDIDALQATPSGGAFRSVNYSVGGLGTVTIGAGQIAPSATGLTISAPGQVGALSSIASGGTGYTATGGVLRDDYGGEWQVATESGGVVSALTMLDAPYEVGSTPTNPIPTYCVSGNCGNDNMTINLAWSATGQIRMGSPIYFPALPTGTAATYACFTSSGELISSSSACP